MSQQECVLTDLLQGRRITPADALREYACSRLAARIAELRRGGWVIQRDMIDVQCTDGHTARVAQYFME